MDESDTPGPSGPPFAPRRLGGVATRDALLQAAADEFAARGYAGARVGRIARRAGVSPQLISYHFGGKAALYRAVRGDCLGRPCAVGDATDPAARVVAALQAVLADPRPARLALWEGLGGEVEAGSGLGDLDPFSACDDALADRLDPAAVAVILLGAITAPVLMPREARMATGHDAGSAGFAACYAAALRQVVARVLA